METKKRSMAKLFTACLMVMIMVAAMPITTAFAATADTDDSTATVEFDPGVLTLKNVPNLNFGKHNITSGAMAPASTADGNVVVSDLRGNKQGWSLTAQLTKFQTGSVDSLAGACIDVNGAHTDITADAGNTSPAAECDQAICITSADDAVKVFFANANAGLGDWTSKWTTAKTLLNVPAGAAVVGVHTATLDWILSDAP